MTAAPAGASGTTAAAPRSGTARPAGASGPTAAAGRSGTARPAGASGPTAAAPRSGTARPTGASGPTAAAPWSAAARPPGASPTALVRLAIRVPATSAEVALARLLPVLRAGAEERRTPGVVEYALYGAPEALPGERELRALAGEHLLEVSVEPVADGWQTAWHAHLTRVTAGALGVRPPWVDGAPDDLVIDPGIAFGAGTHPTTRMCLELLQEAPPGGALCDWGAGTGVLAIAAARLGWAPVRAVELPGGGALIGANAAANGVAVDVVEADLTTAAPWAPTVVANLTLPLLRALAAARPRPRRLIASGVLAGELDELIAAWAPLCVVASRELDGWGAVALAAAAGRRP